MNDLVFRVGGDLSGLLSEVRRGKVAVVTEAGDVATKVSAVVAKVYDEQFRKLQAHQAQLQKTLNIERAVNQSAAGLNKLVAAEAQFERETAKVNAQIQTLNSRLQSGELGVSAWAQRWKTASAAIDEHQTKIRSIGLAMGVMGAAAVAGMGVAINKFDTFEKAIAAATAAAGGGRAELAMYSKTATGLANDLGRGGVTALGVAQALVSIAQAGLKGDAALNVLRSSLVLAAGNQEDFAKISETTVAILTQFQLKSREAARVTNILAAANSEALGGVGAFSEALRIVGPTANEAGESLEATAAALALLIKTGMPAEVAGTALRQMFSELVTPTGKAEQALRTYELTMRDVNPTTKSLIEIVDTLAKKQVDAGTAALVFGDRTKTAYTILAAAGKSGMEAMQAQLTGTQKAQEMFVVMTERQGASLTSLKNQIDLTWTAAGEKLTQALSSPMNALASLLGLLRQLPDPLKDVLTVTTLLGTVFVTATAAAAGLALALPTLRVALIMVQTASPWLLALAAALTAAAAAHKEFNDMVAEGAKRLEVLTRREKELADQLAKMPTKGSAWAWLQDMGGANRERIETQLQNTRKEIDQIKASLTGAAQAVTSYVTAWDLDMGVPPNSNEGRKTPDPRNTNALAKWNEELDKINVKIKEVHDLAQRESMLPDEREIAEKVDPIKRAFSTLMLEMDKLGATAGPLRESMNAVADSLIKNVEGAARMAISLRNAREAQKEVAAQAFHDIQENVTRETLLYQKLVASRGMAEEEASLHIAEIKVNAARKEVAIAKEAALMVGLTDKERRAAQRVASDKATALNKAETDQFVLQKNLETAALRANLSLQEKIREDAQSQAITAMEAGSARTLALIELSGESEIGISEKVHQEQVRLIEQRGATTEAGLQAQIKAQEVLFGKGLIDWKAFEAAIVALEAARVANAAGIKNAGAQADIELLKKITKASRDEHAFLEADEAAWLQEKKTMWEQTSEGQIDLIEQQLIKIKLAMDQAGTDDARREALKTLLHLRENDKRTAQLKSATAERVQMDLDYFNKYVQGLEQISTFSAQFYALQIREVKALAAISGDSATFLAVSFVEAFKQGRSELENLGALARDIAEGMSRAFSDFFFNVMEGKFESLTEVVKNFGSVIKRALADFLSNTVMNTIGELFGSVLGIGTQGAQALQAASQVAASELRNSLVPAVQAASQALLSLARGGVGFTSESTGLISPETGQLIGAAGSVTPVGGNINSMLNILNTANSVGSKLVTSWQFITSTWQTISAGWTAGVNSIATIGSETASMWETFKAGAVGAWQSVFGTTTSTGLQATGIAATGASDGLSATASAASSASSALGAVTIVAAAVSIALTAMRTDISDLGKGIITSLYAAAAITAVATGWTGVGAIVAAVLAIVAFILDITGIFANASEAWLKFPEKLSATLDKEQEAFTGFGKELARATNLEGIATSIQNFKQSIDAFIPGFSERPENKALGLFQVPGLPGATGTEHEGKLLFNFDPFVVQVQEAINKALDLVRETISVRFVDAARVSMPDDVFQAFRDGTIVPLRKAFEDLVAAGDSTIDDVKAFETRMTEVGKILVGFASVSAQLLGIGKGAAKILPDDLLAPLTTMGVALNAALIDLAKSGAATVDDLKRMSDAVEALAQLVLMFSQEAQQLRSLASIVAVTLRGELSDAVSATIAKFRQELVDLANTGTATAAELQALEAGIQALATNVALFSQLTQEIAAMSGDMATLIQAGKDSARLAVAGAAQAIVDATDMLAKAIDDPELAAAAVGLHNAIMAKYALERKLIEDIQAEINRLLDLSNDLVTNALISTSASIEIGDIGPLAGLVNTLNTLATSADNAAVRLWAASAALQAITQSLPGLVTKFGSGVGPGDLGAALGTVLAGAMPAINAMADLFNQAKNAGDLESALTILENGAAAINALAQAGLAAIETWRDQALSAAHATAESQIATASSVADKAIQAERDRVDALTEANDLRVEQLNIEKDIIQEAITLAVEWARAVETLDKFIKNLLLGPSAPPNPRAQVDLAQQFYNQALSAYQANKTPTGLQNVQESAQQYLQALQLLYTRPDPVYVDIFNNVVSQLQALKDEAATRGTAEDSMAASLVSIDEQIKIINQESKDLRDASERTIKAIEKQRDDEIAGIRALETAAVKAINESADRARDGINAGLAAIMGQIATEQQALLTTLLGRQIDLLRDITGGLSPQAFLALKAKETVDELVKLRAIVYAALTGGDVAAALAGATPVLTTPLPTTAPSPHTPAGPTPPEGGWVWDEGVQGWVPANTPHYGRGGVAWGPQLAVVGESPEAIIPLSNLRGGDTIVHKIEIHIDGYDRDPEEILDEAEHRMERSLRGVSGGRGSSILANRRQRGRRR